MSSTTALIRQPSPRLAEGIVTQHLPGASTQRRGENRRGQDLRETTPSPNGAVRGNRQ